MQGGEYICDKTLSLYVKEIGQSLAAVSDRQLPYEFTILNNSTPNAWALPGGKIAINRGLLLELQNEAELAAVLSHEIVHAAARHGAKNMERGMILQAGLLATSYALKGYDYANLAVGGAQVALGMITQKYSRNAELEADYYGMHYMAKAGYNPDSAINLQKTFLRLSKGKKSNWLTGLFASHPPSQERVEANKTTALKFGSTGKINHDIYQQKIGYLKKTAKAYDNYDQAVALIKKGSLKKSLNFLEQAIAIEPDEAQFYGARGDVFFKQKQFDSALNAYNYAINLNDKYFYFFEKRGLTHKQLGHNQSAVQDLKKSSSLLPTAASYNELGLFALNAGDKNGAKQFFMKASSSNSKAGKAALNSYTRLDISDNPQKYIHIRRKENRGNNAIFSLSNLSPFFLHKTALKIRFYDSKGNGYQLPIQIPDRIGSRKSILISIDDQTVQTKFQHTIKINVISTQIF